MQYSLGRLVQARSHTSTRDAQRLHKLGSQSAYVPERGMIPPTFPSHNLICELYEREQQWRQRNQKRSIITI